MKSYWERFRDRLRRYEGSLVRVASIPGPNAKHYLAKCAKEAAIEKVVWGWYYIPPRKEPETPFDFLAQDRNFKVITGQTAASFWNADFIHRDTVAVSVDDPSYGRALDAFFEKRGWKADVAVVEQARKIKHRVVNGLRVEEAGRAAVDCVKRWAFVDAIAVLAAHPELPFRKLAEETSWARIPRTDVRVRQALAYAAHRLFNAGRKTRIRNAFVRGELDEAIDKVKEFE